MAMITAPNPLIAAGEEDPIRTPDDPFYYELILEDDELWGGGAGGMVVGKFKNNEGTVYADLVVASYHGGHVGEYHELHFSIKEIDEEFNYLRLPKAEVLNGAINRSNPPSPRNREVPVSHIHFDPRFRAPNNVNGQWNLRHWLNDKISQAMRGR